MTDDPTPTLTSIGRCFVGALHGPSDKANDKVLRGQLEFRNTYGAIKQILQRTTLPASYRHAAQHKCCAQALSPLWVDTVDKIGDGRAAALMPHARPAAAVCCLPLRATSNATELYLRQLMFKQSSYWGAAARSGSPVF